MARATRPIQLGKTNLALLRGDEDVRQWDDEELLRGQRRSKNGKWTGRPPKVVPKLVHDELVRRKLSRAYDALADSWEAAATYCREVIGDGEASTRDRLKACQIVISMMPKELHINTAPAADPPPWLLALTGGIKSTTQILAEHAIDTTADQ